MSKLLLMTLSTFLLFSCANESDEGSSSSVKIDYSLNTPDCYKAYSSNPILEGGDLFTDSTWNDPSVLFEDGTYIMYASSDVNFNGDIKIYRLVSTDGISWELSPSSAVLEKGTGGDWDNKSTETPSVVKFNGTYHMFYTGYQNNDAVDFEIGHATSPDGITWKKSASNPILTSVGGVATADDFDQFIVAEPGAVVFENKLYVYFTAQGYITTADGVSVNDQLMTIGLITSSDGSTFSAPTRVLDPNQTLFPRPSSWKGYSTPAGIVLDGKMHLYVDLMHTVGPGAQRKLYHAYSSTGTGDWTQDDSEIHDRSEFTWSSEEIRAPSVLLREGILKMWYGGHTALNLAIGFSECDLTQ